MKSVYTKGSYYITKGFDSYYIYKNPNEPHYMNNPIIILYGTSKAVLNRAIKRIDTLEQTY